MFFPVYFYLILIHFRIVYSGLNVDVVELDSPKRKLEEKNVSRFLQSTLVNIRDGCKEVFFDNRLFVHILNNDMEQFVLVGGNHSLARIGSLLMGPAGRIWTNNGFSDAEGCDPDLRILPDNNEWYWATKGFICTQQQWKTFKDEIETIWSQLSLAEKFAVNDEAKIARDCFLNHYRKRPLHYLGDNLKDMPMLLSEIECRKEATENNVIGIYCEQ